MNIYLLQIKWDCDFPIPEHDSREYFKTWEGAKKRVTEVEKDPLYLGYRITVLEVKE